MKSIAVALILALLLSSSAFASVISHRAAAEELLVATHSEQMVEQLRAQMEQVFKSSFAQMGDKRIDKRTSDKYSKKLSDILLDVITWETMKVQLVDVYVAVYTENEIKELTAFYTSPTGKKLLAKMPELIKASMEISQKQMKEALPKIEALTKEIANEPEILR